MRSIHITVLALVLGAPAAAFAANGPMGTVGAYGVHTEYEANGFSADGRGAGIRGWMTFGVPFLHGEYQQSKVEEGPFETDIDNLRVGGGASFRIGNSLVGLGKLEYVDIRSDGFGPVPGFEEDGVGVHAGATWMLHERFHFFATVGYLSLNQTDGVELNAGASLHFNERFGFFADARRYLGSVDNAPGNDDFEITDVRAGAMLLWGS